MTCLKKILAVCIVFILITDRNISAGTVYLVLGSDTAIWDGMNVGRFYCTYSSSLYTDPSRNGYQVMDPEWRSRLVDSYGNTMKLTWWMMAGNIFRYATNRNMPVPNIMTMYFMKKYHGDHIEQFGDELSLHYHTFFWSDYDHDNIFYWNQSYTFMECLDDFEFTLAQFLLEEKVFPVSFRSGWHYMDNGWQNYLDKILPFSMHDDWPAKRTDTTEPLDNTYDWSLASSKFIPWHPSPENYQLEGDGPGWNVRSEHIGNVRYLNLMDTVFSKAAQGIDQVACFWGHLPEEDFITNLEILDSLAHAMEIKYPGTTFRYCTAIEAMQRWMGTDDQTPPQLTFDSYLSDGNVYFRITADEPLFQYPPFVTVKDINEDYKILWCRSTGTNEWETMEGIPESMVAEAGIALTDSVGNQSMEFIEFLPDDIFIDNKSTAFQELYGSWSSLPADCWDLEYIRAQISSGDSAAVRWNLNDVPDGRFNIFYQARESENPAEYIEFGLFQDAVCTDTVIVELPYPENEWLYITTTEISASANYFIDMKSINSGPQISELSADVLKLSALIRDRELYLTDSGLNFGFISEDDTVTQELKFQNRGINPITIMDMYAKSKLVWMNQIVPFEIGPMRSKNVTFSFFASDTGIYTDTLVIISDDPVHPQQEIPVRADVELFFDILDNEDIQNYTEFGDWYYSVAQAYGPSSRYSYLNHGSAAVFTRKIEKNGMYEIYQIVPKTVNSTDRALYTIAADGNTIATLYVNQNEGSGQWVNLGKFLIPGNSLLTIRIQDTGESTTGDVIRADAIKIMLVEEITAIPELDIEIPEKFSLSQNYPNPFNNTTIIEYDIPTISGVQLVVYNMLGQIVKILVNTEQRAGKYQVVWNGKDLFENEVGSGIYFYNLKAGEFTGTKKLIFLK